LGILVAGKDPRYFFPGAYIQFLRLDGLDLADPIKDSKEIDGPLPDLLRRLDDLLTVNISVASDITTQSVEIRRPDYPLVALQQLARNAVLHRTYEGTNAPIRLTWFSDRIEIISPGGPFGQVSRQNFGQPGVADYRNPHLAEAMKNLGYVQRFGVGIHLARQQLEKNGNPPLEFMVEGNYIFATIRR
jgi:ATP-dependent DNA helicase RecG